MEDQKKLMVKLVADAWTSYISRVDNLLNTLTDEDLQHEVSPGRNTGIYLLGHLTAVHDRLLPLLDFGERLYPQLDEAFIINPDKSTKELPPISDLKKYWNEVNATLAKKITALTPDEWFQKHTAVSDDDFAKEPHRNKLNLLMNRTNHLAYHFGQLAFAKTKVPA